MKAPSASTAEHVARQSWVTMSTRRRSNRSAIAPPPREPAISGTACTMPSRPTSRADPVSAYTWKGTATRVICRPTSDTSWPTHSRRNGTDSRSARASTAMVRNMRLATGRRGGMGSGGMPSDTTSGEPRPQLESHLRNAILSADAHVSGSFAQVVIERDTWNPTQYERFRAEREQPFHDLVALITHRPDYRVVDLGC